MRLNVNDLTNEDRPNQDLFAPNVIKSDYSDRLTNSVTRVHSEPPSHSPNRTEMSALAPGFSESVQMAPDVNTCTMNGMESSQEVMELSAFEAVGTEVSAFPILLEVSKGNSWTLPFLSVSVAHFLVVASYTIT